MKKKVFYTEMAYVLGIVILALGTALMEKANFGMSMVVAPAYLLHVKISQTLPFFSFGMAEYTLQAVIIVLLALVMRRFKLSYLFSFCTAVIYGDTVYMSGMIGVDPATQKPVEGGVMAQAKQVFENIRTVLGELELTMDDVLKTTVFLKDMGDFAVLNWDNPITRDQAKNIHSRLLWFSRLEQPGEGAFLKNGRIVFVMDGKEEDICAAADVKIPGAHNLENALAAALLAFVSGVSAQDIAKGLATFTGVEHRIEFVREKDGVRYINDSKGTNSDSTEKAVLSMKNSTVLILGGSDKGTGFDKLARLIAETKEICHCIVLGETAEKITKSLAGAGFAAVTKACSMEEAVKTAAQLAKAFPCGGNVLLSPACASFDMFRDYEERGRVFKEIVNNL